MELKNTITAATSTPDIIVLIPVQGAPDADVVLSLPGVVEREFTAGSFETGVNASNHNNSAVSTHGIASTGIPDTPNQERKLAFTASAPILSIGTANDILTYETIQTRAANIEEKPETRDVVLQMDLEYSKTESAPRSPDAKKAERGVAPGAISNTRVQKLTHFASSPLFAGGPEITDSTRVKKVRPAIITKPRGVLPEESGQVDQSTPPASPVRILRQTSLNNFTVKSPVLSPVDMSSYNLYRPPRLSYVPSQNAIARAAKEAKELESAPISAGILETSEEQRRATWLELFFDIFFVAIIRILSHSAHYTNLEMFYFCVKFTTVWWVWCMITIYDTRWDTDDLFHRAQKLVQMFCAVVFAVSVDSKLDDYPLIHIFSAGVMVVRLTLLINYIVVVYYAMKPAAVVVLPGQPVEMPKLTLKYSDGFPDITSSLFSIMSSIVGIVMYGATISDTVTPAARVSVWSVALLVDIVTQAYVSRMKVFRRQTYRESHFSERMALFTIIIMGEIVIGTMEQSSLWIRISVLSGVKSILLETILIGIFATCIAFSLWWMYFDDFSNAAAIYKKSMQRSFLFERVRNVWMLMHLPFHLLLCLVGVMLNDVINDLGAFRVKNADGAENVLSHEGVSIATDLGAETLHLSSSQLIITFALLYLFTAFVKIVNVSSSDAAKYDRISYISRLLIAGLIFALLAVPSSLFAITPNSTLSPLTFLIMAIAIISLLQVGVDVWVAYSDAKWIKKTISNTSMQSLASIQYTSGFSSPRVDSASPPPEALK